MIEPASSATVLKVGMTVLERAAPKGLSYVQSLLKGRRILVVGQERAGKTTFIDYFHYGLFEEESHTSKTRAVNKSARFDIKVGKTEALELKVSTVVDVPGQVGPVMHAQLVSSTKPHAVIVTLDLTRPLAADGPEGSIWWLSEFTKQLERDCLARPSVRALPKCLMLMLTKADKVTQEEIDLKRTALLKICQSHLRKSAAKVNGDIAAKSCILVTNSKGTQSVDAVISHLARSFAGPR